MVEEQTHVFKDKIRAVRAVVLLAGAVQASQLRKAVGRSLLDLPVERDKMILDLWCDQLTQMADRYGFDTLPIRVMLDRSAPKPYLRSQRHVIEIHIEQDPYDFRGTGGLLADIARAYGDDDYLLVANASQVLLEPMVDLIESLASVDADATMVCRSDGTPSDMMLLRCGVLRDIATVGYVDLKEQALAKIARRHNVQVVRRDIMWGLPVRTLAGYIDGLREYYRKQVTHQEAIGGQYTREWQATFGLVEPGAQVHETAVVHDSVVLKGGVVGPGAILVRSVVSSTGVVQDGQSAVDCLVAGQMSTKRKVKT